MLLMASDPMCSPLLSWGHAHRRWESMGLNIPTATTTAESGFQAHKLNLLEQHVLTVSLATWQRSAQLAVLFLKFQYVAQVGRPGPREQRL